MGEWELHSAGSERTLMAEMGEMTRTGVEVAPASLPPASAIPTRGSRAQHERTPRSHCSRPPAQVARRLAAVEHDYEIFLVKAERAEARGQVPAPPRPPPRGVGCIGC